MLLPDRRYDSRSAEDRREMARLRSLPYQRVKADACASLQRSRSGRTKERKERVSKASDLLRDPVGQLSKIAAEMDRPEGRKRLAEYFARGPYPRFEPIEGDPTGFVKVEENGARRVVRFVDGAFREDA